MNTNALTYCTLLQQDLEDVRQLMRDVCEHIPTPIRQSVSSLIAGGGKRLRPALTLLSSYLCHAEREQAIASAAAVEMLHTATLIHDDLIDDAAIRRGVGTLNARWSPMATVLAGDIVFSLAAELIARAGNTLLVRRFAETLETICVGEIGQMFGRNGHLPTVDDYYRRIYAKTASLFTLCMETGPILAACSDEEIDSGRQLGKLLGEAFQITDDVLDLMGTATAMGKPVGTDLAQGLVTLPVLLYAYENPTDDRVMAVLHQNTDDATQQALIASIRFSNAPRQAMAHAEAHAAEALDLIQKYPASAYRGALEELITFSVHRQH